MGDGASQGLFWLREPVLRVGMMPFAMEVFAPHIGMDEAGPVLFLSIFFQGFGSNKAKNVLKLLCLGVLQVLQAPWDRELSSWASGSHYVSAPSSGICPGKEAPRVKIGAGIPFPPQFLLNWEWRSQGGAKIQGAPSTTLL